MIRRMIITGCISFWASTATAQTLQIETVEDTDASSEPSSETATPSVESATPSVESAPPAMPEGYSDKLEYGHELYLKGDFEGASAAYRAARESKPSDPAALYFIACAQAKLGQYVEALSTLKTLETVCGEKLANLHARGLFLAAVIEETRGNDENTVAAWTAYKQFAADRSDIPSFVASADARIQAVEKKRALDEQYKPVREKIAGGEQP
jgi:tetratricopeptide (TPR) repeat protein